MFDSVAPDVKIISFGLALIIFATCFEQKATRNLQGGIAPAGREHQAWQCHKMRGWRSGKPPPPPASRPPRRRGRAGGPSGRGAGRRGRSTRLSSEELEKPLSSERSRWRPARLSVENFRLFSYRYRTELSGRSGARSEQGAQVASGGATSAPAGPRFARPALPTLRRRNFPSGSPGSLKLGPHACRVHRMPAPRRARRRAPRRLGAPASAASGRSASGAAAASQLSRGESRSRRGSAQPQRHCQD